MTSNPNTSNLPMVWIKNCKDEHEKQELVSLLRNSTTVLRNLRRIMEDQYEEYERMESTIKDFEDPNWSEKQAYRNGCKAQIRRIMELTQFIAGD